MRFEEKTITFRKKTGPLYYIKELLKPFLEVSNANRPKKLSKIS